MISAEATVKIREVLSHQPFLCDKILLYEVNSGQAVPCDEESAAFLHNYPTQVMNTLDVKSGCWYGNIMGTERGRVWGGKYYAGCLIETVLVIVAKPVGYSEVMRHTPPPIDSYFLDTVSHRVSQVLGLSCDMEVGINNPQVTGDGEQVLSELSSLEHCEDLWRSEYGNEEWLAVKGGTVMDHNRDRNELEKSIHKKDIKPPVLYVPPLGKEITADILFGIARQEKKRR